MPDNDHSSFRARPTQIQVVAASFAPGTSVCPASLGPRPVWFGRALHRAPTKSDGASVLAGSEALTRQATAELSRQCLGPVTGSGPFPAKLLQQQPGKSLGGHPRHLRGVLLIRWEIAPIAASSSAAMSVSDGRNRRRRPLKFSTPPFCQGALGSQK
jgi:hypothetical protein